MAFLFRSAALAQIAGGCFALFTLAEVAVADPVKDAIAQARNEPPRQAIQTLLKAEAAAPHNAPLLARISLTWSDVVDVAEDHDHDKVAGQKAAQSALDAAEEAVKADPQNAEAHYSLAVASGKMTDFVDNSKKLELSKVVRDEAEKSVTLDPKEDMAWNALGQWNYGVANMNPMLKFAAKMVYGTMPHASLEDAAHDLEKAVALAPKKIDHHHQLALVYQAMGQHEKATEQWSAVLALPAVTSEDEEAKKEAKKALGK